MPSITSVLIVVAALAVAEQLAVGERHGRALGEGRADVHAPHHRTRRTGRSTGVAECHGPTLRVTTDSAVRLMVTRTVGRVG